MLPFARIRARFLIAWLLAAVALSFATVVVIWPMWLGEPDLDDPIQDAVGGLVLSVLIFVVPALRARSAGLAIGDLYSHFPPSNRVAPLAALAFPMVGCAFIGIYLLFAPLSLAFPNATQAWLFEDQPVLYSAGPPYPFLGNALGLLSITIAAPIAEEWFFRGLLLRRWSHRWGPVRGVVASSMAFALLHVDILGSLVFGIFMCALCAHYRSLWAPTIVHAANNALGWCLAAFDSHDAIPVELSSVEQLRAAWWLPALGLLLVVPWALRLRGRYGPISSWDFATAPNTHEAP